MWKSLGLIILAVIGLLGVLIAVVFIAMSIVGSSTLAWRVLRYGESDIQDYKIFPERMVANGENPSLIPFVSQEIPDEVEYSYKGGLRKENLDDLIARSETRAFLVIKDDRLVYERYLGSSRERINTSFSTAKAFSSALIGAAIADGYIESVDDPVIRYIPEIAGRGLDSLTIRDLLLMNSGISYWHNYELPFYRRLFGDDVLSYYSPDLRKVALSVRASGVPVGEAFRYNNYHLLLEGLILERVTGMPVAEYLQERLWKPMGAEFPASWSLDSEASGFEKMESGINARAEDYARFGLVFLHNGFWNRKQILPAEWVIESTQPSRPDQRRWETMGFWPALGGYYQYHWWGLNNPDGTYDFYTHGKYDQIVYVAPRKNVVIVRLGDGPDGDLYWPLVLQNIVDQLP